MSNNYAEIYNFQGKIDTSSKNLKITKLEIVAGTVTLIMGNKTIAGTDSSQFTYIPKMLGSSEQERKRHP